MQTSRKHYRYNDAGNNNSALELVTSTLRLHPDNQNKNQKQHLMSTAHQNGLIETIKNGNTSTAQINLKTRKHSRSGNQQTAATWTGKSKKGIGKKGYRDH